MKSFLILIVFLAVNLGMVVTVEAQDASSAVTAQVAASATPAVNAVPAGTQVAAPAAINLAPSQAVVAVPVDAAPPAWATAILSSLSKLPVIGPYVTQLLLWLGILAALLTTLVGAALSILATLKSAFTWAGLDSAVAAITAFQNGPIMYYLKYFSNFNAKKPEAKA